MPKHKVHRNPDAWKKDIQVLTCILRLRCQPPVPYSLIASLLLQTRPSLMVRLSEKVAPKNATTGEQDMQTWLEMYLKDVYEKGEVWGSEAWKMAREWNEDGVREMVRSAGLKIGAGVGGEEEGKEGGFVVMDEEELELQIRWKKEGDWRAGSTPLGRPERLDNEEALSPVLCPVRRIIFQIRLDSNEANEDDGDIRSEFKGRRKQPSRWNLHLVGKTTMKLMI